MLIATPLHTARLTLRPLSATDAGQQYLDWLADPEVLRYLEVRHLPRQTRDDLRQFIAACNADQRVLLLGIFTRTDERHIGNIKLGPTDPIHRRADIGFMIGDRPSWGRGFATEAIRAVSDHGLETLGLLKVTAGCYGSNVGSARALEKAGFVREATLRQHWYYDGRFEDGHLYGRFTSGTIA